MRATFETAAGMAKMYEVEIENALRTYHPLKGAIFAQGWLEEALETDDDAWRYECLREASKAVGWLRKAW